MERTSERASEREIERKREKERVKRKEREREGEREKEIETKKEKGRDSTRCRCLLLSLSPFPSLGCYFVANSLSLVSTENSTQTARADGWRSQPRNLSDQRIYKLDHRIYQSGTACAVSQHSTIGPGASKDQQVREEKVYYKTATNRGKR